MQSVLALVLCFGWVCGQPDTAALNAATKRIWEADVNKMCDSDLIFNTTTAGDPLFVYVNEDRLTSTTWTLFKQLLDSYDINEGFTDSCYTNSSCLDLEDAFVDALMDTPAIQEAHAFIGSYLPQYADPADFWRYLRDIWFHPYERHALNDSSGFQHVMVGELKIEGDDVGGFHNWYRLYQEEKRGNLVIIGHQDICDPDVPKFSLAWYGYPKNVDSVWLRTNPETEIAIYTTIFTFEPNSVYTCDIDNYPVDIQTWDEAGTGNPTAFYIGSAYVAC